MRKLQRRSGCVRQRTCSRCFLYAIDFITEVIDADALSSARACTARGTVSVTVTDNDSDLLVSAGDTANIDFTDCLELTRIGAVEGSISVSISEFSGLESSPGHH